MPVTDMTRARLHRIVARLLGVSDAQAATASPDTVPAWDSIAHLSLVMAIEQEFRVQFPADSIMELSSVEAIDRAINEQLAR